MLARIFVIVMGLFLLGGCASTGGEGGTYGYRSDKSAEFKPAKDSRFIVDQALTILPGQIEVVLQNGAVTTVQLFNRYKPHCIVRVSQGESGKGSLEPDSFQLSRIWRRHYSDGDGVISAPYLGGSFGPYWGSYLMEVTTEAKLNSVQQPWVKHLICSNGWAQGYRVDYPSVAGVKQSLGTLAHIE